MGNCNFRSESIETTQSNPSIALASSLFKISHAIGKGGFGKVWRVEQKKSRLPYAMKEMEKARIIHKRSVQSVMNERRLLAMLRHPFMVNIQYAYQDREKLYLVMDLMPGGDLRYHISKQRRFSEPQTRFFIACILASLEYLHGNGVIHRDIKPENLVLDQGGYVHLTDFGIARVWQPENKHETSGTPGYMAPEVICRQNHGFEADYFALGVIIYEFMLGRRPYQGKSRKEIRDAILAKQVQIRPCDVPEGWSAEACDLANRLLQRKPQHRIGTNGIEGHDWLKVMNWTELMGFKMTSPFIPGNKDNFDFKQVNSEWKDEVGEVDLQSSAVQSVFAGYYYDSACQPEAVTSVSTEKVQN
jgi:serine/threonine protein kinase